MALTSNPKLKKLLKDIEATCQAEGWVWEGRFQETTEAHLETMISGICNQMGIKQQSFWITYSDLLEPEIIAGQVHDAIAQSDAAPMAAADVQTSVAKAARVLVSLGHIPVCLADGRNTLLTKAGLSFGLGIITMAGEAITEIAFAISNAADLDTVVIPGVAAYRAVTSLTDTIEKIESGSWSTGDPYHDSVLIKGLTHNRDLIRVTP